MFLLTFMTIDNRQRDFSARLWRVSGHTDISLADSDSWLIHQIIVLRGQAFFFFLSCEKHGIRADKRTKNTWGNIPRPCTHTDQHNTGICPHCGEFCSWKMNLVSGGDLFLPTSQCSEFRYYITLCDNMWNISNNSHFLCVWPRGTRQTQYSLVFYLCFGLHRVLGEISSCEFPTLASC